MHRQSETKNAPLEVKENESKFTEELEEASFPDLPKDQKIPKAIKSKGVKASKKENFNYRNLMQVQKRSLEYSKGLEEELYHKEEGALSFFDVLKGDVVGESPLPLNGKENLSGSRPASLRDECYLTPSKDGAEEESDCGISEKQGKKPVDFAAVTIAEFGISQDSFTKGSIVSGWSPTLLKFRRRSTIGVRGSPENNALIQYLARQRSKKPKKAITEVSDFKQERVRSLKDKIDAFQASFSSVQEAEGEPDSFAPSQVGGASQEAACYFSSDHETKDIGSKKKVSFVEEVSLEIFDESKPPSTPVQSNISLNEHFLSGSHPRSVLKKTPVKQVMDSLKEHSKVAVDRGDESPPVSNSAEILEVLQTEKTGSYSCEKPKKRVTFGEVLSPEIFDKTLPANTPLRKGATPLRHPGLQSSSPLARPSLVDLKSLKPLAQPNFDSDDDCAEPLQESVEGSVVAEDLLPVQNAEAETDKSDITPCSSTEEEQGSTISEGTDCTISKATDTKDAEETKNPRKNRSQRQKNAPASAAKKTQKAKRATYGKRRKKKVKKSLYGEREMASKKPLLSPIPEMPEIFSSASTPNSPKANAFFSGDIKSGNSFKDVVERIREKSVGVAPVCSGSEDLDALGAESSSDAAFPVADGDPNPLSDPEHELSDIVPDSKCVFDTSEYSQQSTETACVKGAKESSSLMENEKLQGNLDKAEQLTRLEFLDKQDTQGTRCPQEDSVRGNPARKRRRSSSAIYFPPVEKLETTGNNLPISPFNIEEVLSAPQQGNDSSEPRKRKNRNSGDKVRRSMRLQKGVEAEGLAWVQVPSEIQKDPPLASVGKIRRTISTPILRESENIHHREQNPVQFFASRKENNDSVELVAGPCKRWRRKTTCLSAPQETRTLSRTQRRSMANSVIRKDRNNKHAEEVEIPLESSSNI